jgi:hypothetical protein
MGRDRRIGELWEGIAGLANYGKGPPDWRTMGRDRRIGELWVGTRRIGELWEGIAGLANYGKGPAGLANYG